MQRGAPPQAALAYALWKQQRVQRAVREGLDGLSVAQASAQFWRHVDDTRSHAGNPRAFDRVFLSVPREARRDRVSGCERRFYDESPRVRPTHQTLSLDGNAGHAGQDAVDFAHLTCRGDSQGNVAGEQDNWSGFGRELDALRHS